MKNLTKRLKDLISNNKIEVVINELKDLPISDNELINQIVLLSANFNRYYDKLHKGLSDNQQANIELTTINNSLLYIIDHLPNDLIQKMQDEINVAMNRYDELKKNSRNLSEYVNVFKILDRYKNSELFTAQNQEILAFLYREGLGTIANQEIAFELYKKSAESDWGWGQYGLAEMYDRQSNNQESLKWFKKAAENNVNWAFQSIGDIYRDGKGEKRDTNKAMEYYLKSAFRGIDWGYTCIGDFLFNGTETIDKDLYVSKIMFEKGAELGNEHAKYMLTKF